jgi:hypothetical protein
VKTVRLFSNSEYIDIVLVYGKVCESATPAQRISVRFLLVGVHERLRLGPHYRLFIGRQFSWLLNKYEDLCECAH